MTDKHIAKQRRLLQKLALNRDAYVKNPCQHDDFWEKFTASVKGLIKHSGDDPHVRSTIADTFDVFDDSKHHARLPKLAFIVAEAAALNSRRKISEDRVNGYRALEEQAASLCALFLMKADMPRPQLAGVRITLEKSKSAALQAIRFEPAADESIVKAQPWCSLVEIEGLQVSGVDKAPQPKALKPRHANPDLTAGW